MSYDLPQHLGRSPATRTSPELSGSYQAAFVAAHSSGTSTPEHCLQPGATDLSFRNCTRMSL